jgi:Ca2+-binding RTX toxin-like protein
MTSHIAHTRRTILAASGALLAWALSVSLVGVVRAQTAVDCNGVPATIVAAAPGHIQGTAAKDVIVGSTGDDQIDGLGGDDLICAGEGNDTIAWGDGGGSDVVEGQGGEDTLLFSGSSDNERITLSASGVRLVLARDVSSVTLDVGETERIAVTPLGGADTIAVGNLSGTPVDQVDLSLALLANGRAGDSQADRVVVAGTLGPDTMAFDISNGRAAITGLSAAVTIGSADGPLDTVQLDGLAGNDTIGPSAAQPAVFKVFLSLIAKPAGTGIIEARALEERQAEAGSQPSLILNGGQGNDLLTGSSGDDTFLWNPGDGNDTVEGQAGQDSVQVNGANISENISIAANGARVRFFRDVANITMDVDGVERFGLAALGGADTITVDDLSATSLSQIDLALAATVGGGDGQADRVIVNATNGDDAIIVVGSAGQLVVNGLHAKVTVSDAEVALDALTVNALAGNDVVDASALAANVMTLTTDGGDGDDVLIGSAGGDTIFGRAGDDVLIGGPGVDILDGGTGNNVVIQD